MSTLLIELNPTATDVQFTDDYLRIRLSDGRELAAPLTWFPRLRDASEQQRRDWRLIGRGSGIHWTALDEDVSVASLLRRS